MKRKFFAFILLLTAGLSLSSCLGNDDDMNIEYTHDTAITAFSLGTLTRYYHGVSANTGNDTTYSASVSGASYKFYIDQVSRQIYNADSLPIGTKTSAVLATITAKQSSPLLWQAKDKADSLYYYSSSDSVDFSEPRQIRVYNNDFSAYSTYSITVNVHKEDPDSFVWRSLTSQNAALAALSHVKAVAVGRKVFLFGTEANNLKVYMTSDTDGASWSVIVPQVALSTEAYQNIVVLDGVMYVLDHGVIMKSTDGVDWQTVASDASLLRLIGASSKYLYAYTAVGISVSKDQGATWSAEDLDADATNLPQECLSMTIAPIRSTKNAENLLLLGNREAVLGDSIATLWLRTVDYNTGAENGQWNLVEYDANQRGKLPYLDYIQVAANDSGYVALGAGTYGGAAKAKWYTSKTGLTWTVDTSVVIPTNFLVNKPTAFVRDNNNFYWIVNGGNVWKGRYNRDGWRKE